MPLTHQTSPPGLLYIYISGNPPFSSGISKVARTSPPLVESANFGLGNHGAISVGAVLVTRHSFRLCSSPLFSSLFFVFVHHFRPYYFIVHPDTYPLQFCIVCVSLTQVLRLYMAFIVVPVDMVRHSQSKQLAELLYQFLSLSP